MNFVTAVKSGFQNALKFSGRSRRPDYWWFFVFVFAGGFLFSVIDHLAFGPGREVLIRVFQVIVFLPFLAVAWRRLQDTGRPGWWVLVPSGIVVASALLAGSVSRSMFAHVVDQQGPVRAPISMQDTGLLLALSLFQIAAGLVIIWWMSRPSQRGDNRYGPEPRVKRAR